MTNWQLKLYGMNFSELDKTGRRVLLASGKTDARYGNGKCSPDFNLFQDSSPIIQKLSEDLTQIMMQAVKSEVYVYDSFFNILGAGGGTTPHAHLNALDTDIGFNLDKQKYSLVYYLSIGDQNCKHPGILKFYKDKLEAKSDKEILPSEGMIVIFPADTYHSVKYDGNKDRIIVGVNFYSI